MRKNQPRKLNLSKETLLSLDRLNNVQGALDKTEDCNKETFSFRCESGPWYCPFTHPCPIWV
jgi:hypothetical protein